MLKYPARKCRCPSKDHGHKPGKCNNLATEHDQLCKSCSDREGTDLEAKASRRGSAQTNETRRTSVKKGPT
jgi:hypothetical protein